MTASSVADSNVKSCGPRQLVPRGHVIAAVAIGNAIEWFEIVVFGYFAVIVAELFFPSSNSTTSLLLTLASFGIAYVMRPLGAVVLGVYTDRKGRKAALQLSILLMALGSLTIAVAPTYSTMGIAASILVVAARMLQGFSVGGEFGSATAFLAEQTEIRRGFFASWQFASQGLAALLATGFGAVITFTLTPEQVSAWGWRIPFMFAVAIVPIGFYIRQRVSETVEFQTSKYVSSPLRSVLLHAKAGLLISLGLVVLGTVAVYTILFLPIYAVRILSLPTPNSFAAGFLTGATQFALIPIFGGISDRLGRTLIPIAAACAILFGVYPIFVWLSAEPTIAKLLVVQGLFGIVTAAYLGSLPALMAELFPVRTRGTGLSISYAFGVAIFGGFTPFIHVWLIAETGNILAPAFYVALAAIVSLSSLVAARHLEFR